MQTKPVKLNKEPLCHDQFSSCPPPTEFCFKKITLQVADPQCCPLHSQPWNEAAGSRPGMDLPYQPRLGWGRVLIASSLKDPSNTITGFWTHYQSEANQMPKRTSVWPLQHSDIRLGVLHGIFKGEYKAGGVACFLMGVKHVFQYLLGRKPVFQQATG